MYKQISIRISVLILVLMIGLIALSTGCAGAATMSVSSTTVRVPGSLDFPLLDESFKSTFPESMNLDNKFLLKTDKDEYPTDTTKIPFTIENRSDRDMMTGEPYALEFFRDNAWYTVPYKKLDGNVKRAWLAVAYLISAKDSWLSSVSLSEHITLTSGRYRLIKEIMSQDQKDRQSFFVLAEFRVTDPEKITGDITRSEGSSPGTATTTSDALSSGSTTVPATTTTASSRASGSYYFPLLEESVKSAIPEIASPYVDAVMKTDQETYSTSAAKIQFTIESRSEHEVMTGEPYSLEIFRDSTWYTVPFKKLAGNVVRAWSADGHPIPAQGSLPGFISLSEHLPLIAGRYRLVKEIMTQDRKDYWGNSYIWAEFRVISD